MTRQYARHKLSKSEGERILWHALEYVQNLPVDYNGEHVPALKTILDILTGMQGK